MDYEEVISDVVQVVEGVGAAIMVVGGLIALVLAAPSLLRSDDREGAYLQLRRNLGRVILVGLEVLIIGDIVRTIIVDPDVGQVLVLAGIVLIRIVLSFALEVEIDGRWPWREQELKAPPT